eukprot:2433656-Pyramimonas_sp.AAC.1
MPKTLLGDNNSAGPLRRLGRDLQVVSTVQARDHVPVHLCMEYSRTDYGRSHPLRHGRERTARLCATP